VAWLTFLDLAAYNTQSVYFSPPEWLALIAAIGISIWCMAKPLGGPKYELKEPADLLGAFVSRTSWGLALFGAILTIGGVAGSMAAIYDVSTGRATIGDAFKDIGVFIEGWIAELIAPTYDAELEKTHAYALFLLLIPGVLLVWYNLIPFFKRGNEFQVHPRRPTCGGAATASGVLPRVRGAPARQGQRRILPAASGRPRASTSSRCHRAATASPHAVKSRRPLGQTGAVQLVTIDDIRAAAELIRPYIVRTPLVPAGWADDERPLWIKPESLQQIGAFKVRGAFNAIANLDESVRTRGVVAYSSGNHAQAVAYAAAIYGVPAHIVMPRETPHVKVAATRSHGAEVVLCGAGEREKVAAQLVEQTGGILVPPFDHRDIIAGQGTIGLEIAEDLPAVDTVLIPVSGGGLASGIGIAIKGLCPDARVFGVEPELAADTAEGLRLGHRVDWTIADRNRTIADGLRSQPSELTFAHLQQVLDGVITVSENEIRAAVRELAYRARLVAEPSGAVALAAYRKGATPSGRTVMIMSGGNIEPPMLQEILAG
jgi:threo-3-hydroxy-L-aspartate ammonia-lyase